MTYFNARIERERKQRDNDPDRIIKLAIQKGRFEVSLRWRDDGLRAVCARMVKRGLLRGGRRDGDHVVFFPVTTSIPEPTSMPASRPSHSKESAQRLSTSDGSSEDLAVANPLDHSHADQ